MRTGVQFRGLKQVLTAYQANNIAPWSIFSGKNMVFRYEGDDINEGVQQIKQAFKLLKDGGSEGAYTLKVYEEPKDGRIKSNTPDDGSFLFSLFDQDGEQNPYQRRQATVMGMIEDKFTAMQSTVMEAILSKMNGKDDEDEPEPPKGVIGFLGSLLENPDIQKIAAQKILQLLGMADKIPGVINGIEKTQQPQLTISQDQIDKVNEAIRILASCDTHIGDHLLKVAAIARDNPMKYKSFTLML